MLHHLERTDGVTKKIEAILKSIPEIDLYTTVNGNNLLNNTVAPNAATFFITLKPWQERHKTALDIVAEVNARCMKEYFRSYGDSSWPSANYWVGKWCGLYHDAAGPCRKFSAVSRRTGAKFHRRQQVSVRKLGKFIPFYRANVPQKSIQIDKEKVDKLGLNLDQVNSTVSTMLGGSFCK